MSTRSGRCPQCSRSALLEPANPWRPFCSERCKTLDLGDWMSGRYGIPVAEGEAESEDAPPQDSARLQ